MPQTFVAPKYGMSALAAAKGSEGLRLLYLDIEELYRILNGISYSVPPGLVVRVQNEGSGTGAWDNTTNGVASFRTLVSDPSLPAIVPTTSSQEIKLTFVPGAVPISMLASPQADVSWAGHKLTNLADPVNPTDAVNLRAAKSLSVGTLGGLYAVVLGETTVIPNGLAMPVYGTNVQIDGELQVDGILLFSK